MKSALLFEFTVNRESNTLHIVRAFDASAELVWEAWTNKELLQHWWAPKPYHIETKNLDLRVGGMWLYAMVSPQDEKMWCKADYKKIQPTSLLSWLDAFCDENGVENTIKPRSLWTIHFSEKDDVTTADITLQHDRLEDLEMMIQMGFQEGMTMALGNLDELLQTKK